MENGGGGSVGWGGGRCESDGHMLIMLLLKPPHGLNSIPIKANPITPLGSRGHYIPTFTTQKLLHLILQNCDIHVQSVLHIFT